jgi:hypothetical protein
MASQGRSYHNCSHYVYGHGCAFVTKLSQLSAPFEL